MNTALQAASVTFAIQCSRGGQTHSQTAARVERVLGPLKMTVTLLQEGRLRLCLLASDFPTTSFTFSRELRKQVGAVLDLPSSHVLNFNSHDHSVPLLESNSPSLDIVRAMQAAGRNPKLHLVPLGRKLLRLTTRAAKSLPSRLEPVTVWWAVGHENRISYNRKGRRADGSTFFMREEDRVLYGRDFCGDTDTDNS